MPPPTWCACSWPSVIRAIPICRPASRATGTSSAATGSCASRASCCVASPTSPRRRPSSARWPVIGTAACRRARTCWSAVRAKPTPSYPGPRCDCVLPSARAPILDDVAKRGCAISLHRSFETRDRPELFAQQRRRLERLTGRPVLGVRQHFLRMRPGATQGGMQAAEFRYDTTWGFPDRNGFRVGVADVIPVWDAVAERPIGLDEVPLCWMDRTLSKYAGIEDPGAWVAEGEALAQVCRQVEGLWVGVWHPNLTPALGFPDAPGAFHTLLDRLVAQQPFIGTLSAVVAWRAARRSIRVRRLTPDGRIDAHAPVRAALPLRLEDPGSRTLQTVNALG